MAALGGARQGHGSVIATRTGLAVRIAGVNIPLPAAAALAAGTPVEITVTTGDSGLQVKVKSESTSSPTLRAEGVRGLIGNVLQTLGATAIQNVDAATGILPAGGRLSELTVRMLLGLFLSRGQSGKDLATIAIHIRSAVTAGAFSPELANAVLSLLNDTSASDDRQFRSALEKAIQRTRSSIEARIAATLTRGDSGPSITLQGDLRAQLLHLRENEALVKFLAGKGALTAFREAVDRSIE